MKLQKYATGISLSFSFIALIISIKTCGFNEKTLEIKLDEYLAEKSIVLTSEIKSKSTLRITPINQNIVVQQINLHYPSELNISSRTMTQPNMELYLDGLKRRLQTILVPIFPFEKNSIFFSDLEWVPIVLETNFVAKSQVFFDRSIYHINYSYGVDGEQNSLPTISISSISFIKRVSLTENMQYVLDEEWKTALKKLKGS